MSYFEYTARDLAAQRAAGILETRREVGEQILALIEDTARKMNGETATDPDAEKEYDRGYLMEDLLSRLANFASNYVPDASSLFPAVMDGRRAVPAYPLLIEEQEPERIKEIAGGMSDRCPLCNHWPFKGAHGPLGCGASGDRTDGRVCGCKFKSVSQEDTIDLTDAIRETWEAQTLNGIPRHEHVGMPDDKCYHSFSGVRCNHYFGNAVHETDFEQRSNRS